MLEFVVVSLLVEITPGPNMAYLAALSATRGRRAGLAAVAGMAAGLLCTGVIAALGLAALIQDAPIVGTLLRWGGIAYLLWLAFEAWRGGGDVETEKVQQDGTLAWRGFLINLLNPKAAVFYLTILPGFLDPAQDRLLMQNLILVAIYVSIATLIHAAIAIAAAAALPLIAPGSLGEQRLRRGLALALAAVAVWLFFSTRK